MKKALLIAAVAGFAMVSCKKDYTCECTNTTTDFTNGVATVIGTSNTTTTYKAKEKDAKASCDNLVATTMVGTTQDGLKSETTCNLK